MGRRRYTAVASSGDHGLLLGLGDNDHPQYTLDPHGAPEHTDIERSIWMPANEGYPATGAPGMSGFFSVVKGAANGANDPTVYFSIDIPEDFVSFTSVMALWSSSGAAGNMRWYIHASYASLGEAYNTHLDQPVFGESGSGPPNTLRLTEAPNPLTLVNLVAEDKLGLQFARDGVHANDTLDAIMSLYGLLFTYTARQ